jgi:uncharacterized protein YdhG (YjbR/CyaY superfamily)
VPKIKARTVDEYLAALPAIAVKHARAMRALLKKSAPKAVEAIKWNTPVYEETRILFAFAAYQTHLNFMPTPSVMKAFAKDLAGYETGKGSVRFPYDRPLPKGLITKLAKARVKELREKDARWM